ncbi:MAG: glycosyltransferase, partial [Caldilineaceae bacterium]|nr:glycosyltransferase [Caldilineaceae bacterium]
MAHALSQPTTTDAPRLSIVIPLYNEEESIPHLRSALHAALEDAGETYEIVIVDDGSRDRSFALLREWAAEDPTLTVIRLRRN